MVDSRWATMIVVRPDLEPVERVLDEPLRFVVERAGRLVEEQDRRVLEDRPGDRDALALAARQPRAAVADDRVVAVGQRADEVVGVGRPGRGDDLGLGRVEPAVQDVLADRAAEQRRLLGDQADLAAQAGHGHVADVDAVDPDRARRSRPTAAG